MVPWLTFGTALLGIIATILAYRLNPKVQASKKLYVVMADIQAWERKRDEALEKNDSAIITICASKLAGLYRSKAGLLRQLGDADGGG